MKRRHKGEGSIIKLSNGSYKATITIGKGIDGKQKRRSVTCKTQTELMDKITELRVHVKHQRPSDSRINGQLNPLVC